MLRMVPSRSELRARITKVAFALYVWSYRNSSFGGKSAVELAVETEGGGMGCALEAPRNLEVRLEKEVTRLYSSCVSVRIECKLICVVLKRAGGQPASYEIQDNGRNRGKRRYTQ